jgi:hypothetical protein
MVESLLRLQRQPRWFGCTKTCNWREWHLAVSFFSLALTSHPYVKILDLRQFPSASMTRSSYMRPTTLTYPALSTTMGCLRTRRLGMMVPSASPSAVSRTAKPSLTRLTFPTLASGVPTGFTHTLRCGCIFRSACCCLTTLTGPIH